MTQHKWHIKMLHIQHYSILQKKHAHMPVPKFPSMLLQPANQPLAGSCTETNVSADTDILANTETVLVAPWLMTNIESLVIMIKKNILYTNMHYSALPKTFQFQNWYKILPQLLESRCSSCCCNIDLFLHHLCKEMSKLLHFYLSKIGICPLIYRKKDNLRFLNNFFIYTIHIFYHNYLWSLLHWLE